MDFIIGMIITIVLFAGLYRLLNWLFSFIFRSE